MRQLIGTGAIGALNPSSQIDVLKQVTDMFRRISADVSQVFTEYNQEVYTVLSTLPQGTSDTRWDLGDTISPKVNNLDGANVFVHTLASSTLYGGRYWDSDNERPTTLLESLEDLHDAIGEGLDELREEIASISSTGLTSSQIARIGANIFDASQTSSDSSLDGMTQLNQRHLLQLARDMYDDDHDSWTNDGTPLLSNFSHRDHISALLALHGGTYNTDNTLTHAEDADAAYRFFTGGTDAETSSNVEVVVGGFTFDPSKADPATIAIDFYFTGLLKYTAAGAAGSGDLRLYDMGAPGAIGAGVLRSTLTRSHTAGNILGKVQVELDTAVAPGVDADEIFDSERLYELRMLTDGLGNPADVIGMTWGGIIAVIHS